MLKKIKFSEITSSIKSLPNISMLEKVWKNVDEKKFCKAFKEKFMEYARDFWFLLCKGDVISLTLWDFIFYAALYFAVGVSLSACLVGWAVSYMMYYFLETYSQMRYFDIQSQQLSKELKEASEAMEREKKEIYEKQFAWREDPRVQEVQKGLHEIGIG